MFEGSELPLKHQMLKIVKGYTKVQGILFTLNCCADIDLASSDAMEILEPMFPVLDHGWLVPVHVARLSIFHLPRISEKMVQPVSC